jgi:diketogulonate reductase-like aldo/keto reductase
MAKLSFTDALPMRGAGSKIPQLGYGVGGSHVDVCPTSCVNALKIGYRHIDTAQAYGNEAEVGKGVKQSDVPREDIFICTKVLKPGDNMQETYKKCAESVKKLDDREGGYVDLFLIHNANIGLRKRRETWFVLEQLMSEGKVKAIGVSNYSPAHMEEMKEYATVWPPAVNQIEVHPISALQALLHNISDKPIVSSLGPAERGGELLQRERYCRRGVLPNRSQQKSRRSSREVSRRQAYRHSEPSFIAILPTERHRATDQER